MKITQILAKKRDGKKLSREEIAFVVRGAADGSIPDYQLSAFLMAVCIRGMDEEETTELTWQMAQSGDQADLSAIEGIKVDKHSTGGVGDLTSLVAIPLAAACGVKVPKMSGRGLGHTGGTLDKLWSVPGCRTDLSMEAFIGQVRSIGCAIIGQTGSFAPVDKRLYALRDVTGTVESLPLIVSSILSKKLAAGCDAMVLDVKTGGGAFMQTLEDSKRLAQAMVSTAAKAGKRAVALVTDMDQPLGRCIGNAIEVAEAADILKGRRDGRARELCLTVAACMVELGTGADEKTARRQVEDALASGRGAEKLKQMLAAQGGDGRVVDDPSLLPAAPVQMDVLAQKPGYIFHMDCRGLGLAAHDLGAGREEADDEVDPSVGIELFTEVGEWIDKGQRLARVFAKTQAEALDCEKKLLACIRLSDEQPKETKLVLARIG